MKINLKLRLKSKATLTALIAAGVAFIYQVLGLLGVAPKVSQDTLINAIGLIINLLVGMGVIVDPTTEGVSDSAISMQKDKPKSMEEELVSRMPTESLTSSDDAYADPDISDDTTEQILYMEEKDEKGEL